MPESDSTHFFSAFEWPIPVAFGDALASAAFKAGDCLYNHPTAYSEPWGGPGWQVTRSIQITSPDGPPAGRREGESAVLQRNWHSPIQHTLSKWYSPSVSRTKSRSEQGLTTTQGRLIQFLQTGDFALLDSTGRHPPPPKSVGALKPKIISPSRLRELMCVHTDASILFAIPYDPTGGVGRMKSLSIKNLYSVKVREQPFDFPLEIFDVPEAEKYMPTVCVRVFAFDADELDHVHDALKKALVTPANSKQDAKSKKTDRFKIERHGVLIGK